MCKAQFLLVATALALRAGGAVAQQPPAPAGNELSFVVLGHVRGGENGNINFLLPELVADAARLKPDVVFLTGDMIYGQVGDTIVDRAVVERQWQELDTMVARIGAPVYRVPGNHDINDPVTRDLYFERYGPPTRVVDMNGVRFILLNSAFIPQGNGPAPKRRPHIRGAPLDSMNIAALRSALSDTTAYQHAFVLIHHLLWWEANAAWWRDVHPLLVGKKVRAVVSGDYGPMKFSHERRDSIDYLQTSMEGLPGERLLRNRLDSRLLSQQFDNYLSVHIAGSNVDFAVRPIGAIGSGKFTSARWRSINEYTPSRSERIRRAWTAVKPPKRMAALIAAVAVCFALGYATAAGIARRRARSARLR